MKSHLEVLTLAAILAAGCDRVGKADGDTGSDASADTDTDTDADTDADCGQGDCGPPWGWYDETSGLCWQDPLHDVPLSWDDAIEYCEALVLCGRDDWRLPSISELRTFIRGCEATMPGGECGVTDLVGYSNSACAGCPGCEGPGFACGGDEPGGVYLSADVVGGEIYEETGMIWSSTPFNGTDSYIWILFISLAEIVEFEKVGQEGGESDTTCAAVCVRDGP